MMICILKWYLVSSGVQTVAWVRTSTLIYLDVFGSVREFLNMITCSWNCSGHLSKRMGQSFHPIMTCIVK